MKRKTLFKRLIALGLTAVLSLPAMVAVHAEGEADTASVALVAANLVGKTVTIDGVRGEDEGWTVDPTLTIDSVKNIGALKMWLGTDGTSLYGYMEIQHGNTGGRRLLEAQFDFVNSHDETNEDGTAKWTKDTYRQMLGKEELTGVKSAWLQFDIKDAKCYAARQYKRASDEEGTIDPSNSNSFLSSRTGDWKTVSNDCAIVEFKIDMPQYVRDGLKDGTYTIGAGGAYCWGWSHTQHDTAVHGTFPHKNGKATTEVLEPALLPDVILPCTSAPVGHLLGIQAADMGETYGIRFLATTDNKTDYSAYKSVGFDFTLAGNTKKVEKTCEFVYDSVTADYGATTVSAKDHGANYIYACTIEGLAKTGTYTFTVTPWTLAKGEGAEKVYGTAYTVVYTDGVFVSATPVAAN